MQQSSTSSQNTLRIRMLKHMIYHLRLSTSLKLIGTENQNVFEPTLAMFNCFGMVLHSQITSESYRRDFVLLLQKHQLYVCYHILYLLFCYHMSKFSRLVTCSERGYTRLIWLQKPQIIVMHWRQKGSFCYAKWLLGRFKKKRMPEI